MIFQSLFFLFLYVTTQVESHSKSEVEDIRKDCFYKFPPHTNEDYYEEAKFDHCFLLGTEIMNDKGKISKKRLRHVLRVEYPEVDKKFIKEVVEACVDKQENPVLTALYLRKACWFDPTKKLKLIQNIVYFWQCVILLSPTYQGQEAVNVKTFECFIGKTKVVGEDGTLNKAELVDFLESFNHKQSVIDKILECSQSQVKKFHTIRNIYECITQNKS
ncbi:hypothetical protein WA026_009422 [Henosepilachna vigintioctopunctata]|uniref:Uncharacterized protein n=1 Tax=Henosepilachna vigintioctopunctata TaxID=420089 RepID=A0AAW1U3R3_9CUCU